MKHFNRALWVEAIEFELVHWENPEVCPHCGEWVGHFGGSTDRDPCALIQQDVPLEEIRPNCYAVRRHYIGDAIRAACEQRRAG